MKTNPPPNPPETLLHLQALNQRAKALHAQGHYQEALEICLQATRIQPDIADAWGDAGVNCARLGRWQEAIEYAQTALTRGCKTFGPPDTLAHVYGYLGQWNQSRRYGLQALNMRERQFGGPPVIPPPKPGPMPPPPGPQTREHNIIAFSLFGAECKY
jgi:tetratricopeptide (TPR) repeat protein